MAARIVFVAHRVPVPADSGAPIRTQRLLRGLAREFAVTLVAPQHLPGSPDGPSDLERAREELPGVELVTPRGLGGGKRHRQLLSVVRARSWEFGRYRTPAFRSAVQQAASGAALVHYDDVGAGLVGPVPGALSSFAPHNIEHQILSGAATVDRGVRRAFARVDGAKVRREETSLWIRSDLCVAVSDADAEVMRDAGAQSVHVCPNGTDPVDRLPRPRRDPSEPMRLLFVGAGDYRPNRLGLQWLLDEVLPRMSTRLPISLDIVGRPPQGLKVGPGVTIRGRVESVAPFYERAHAALVPVPYGSGTRLKVVEAMARGVPLVSTRIGAAGLGVEPGVHYLAADDPAGFAEAIVEAGSRLAGVGASLEPMLIAARTAAERLFWPELTADLAEWYDASIARRSS